MSKSALKACQSIGLLGLDRTIKDHGSDFLKVWIMVFGDHTHDHGPVCYKGFSSTNFKNFNDNHDLHDHSFFSGKHSSVLLAVLHNKISTRLQFSSFFHIISTDTYTV